MVGCVSIAGVWKSKLSRVEMMIWEYVKMISTWILDSVQHHLVGLSEVLRETLYDVFMIMMCL